MSTFNLDPEDQQRSLEELYKHLTHGSLIFIGVLKIHNVLYFCLLGNFSIFLQYKKFSISSYDHLSALSEEQHRHSFVFHKINFQFLEINFKNKRTVRVCASNRMIPPLALYCAWSKQRRMGRQSNGTIPREDFLCAVRQSRALRSMRGQSGARPPASDGGLWPASGAVSRQHQRGLRAA